MQVGRRGLLVAGCGGAAAAVLSGRVADAAAPYIVGMISWRGTKAQAFLSDGRYERLDLATGRVDEGYPRPVNDATWPGLGAHALDIVATCDGAGGKAHFFLGDGLYAQYDVAADRTDPGYPVAVNEDNWPGLAPYARLLCSALNWPGDKIQLFLTDGRYLRYDLALRSVEPGYPRAVNDSTWPGVGRYRFELAGMWNAGDGKAFIFLKDGRFIRYDVRADRADPGFPRSDD